MGVWYSSEPVGGGPLPGLSAWSFSPRVSQILSPPVPLHPEFAASKVTSAMKNYPMPDPCSFFFVPCPVPPCSCSSWSWSWSWPFPGPLALACILPPVLSFVSYTGSFPQRLAFPLASSIIPHHTPTPGLWPTPSLYALPAFEASTSFSYRISSPGSPRTPVPN
jgi:hypothetical protein